jgi:hypothetical protein
MSRDPANAVHQLRRRPQRHAEVASRQRLRLRLGQLVETAFLWKGTEKQESVKNEVRMCDRLHVRGGGMRREGGVQKSKILKYHAWDLNRCSAAFRLGAQEIAGQQTLVELSVASRALLGLDRR